MKHLVYILRFTLTRVLIYPLLFLFCVSALDTMFNLLEWWLYKVGLAIVFLLYLFVILRAEIKNYTKFFKTISTQRQTDVYNDILDN